MDDLSGYVMKAAAEHERKSIAYNTVRTQLCRNVGRPERPGLSNDMYERVFQALSIKLRELGRSDEYQREAELLKSCLPPRKGKVTAKTTRRVGSKSIIRAGSTAPVREKRSSSPAQVEETLNGHIKEAYPLVVGQAITKMFGSELVKTLHRVQEAAPCITADTLAKVGEEFVASEVAKTGS